MDVALREVLPEDLDFFFELQRDPQQVATTVPAKDRPAFDEWQARVRASDDTAFLTITVDGEAVGNIMSFEIRGVREVGYRIAEEFWGQGIATLALEIFLETQPRPLHATTTLGNIGSHRVLERNGFVRLPDVDGDAHFVLR